MARPLGCGILQFAFLVWSAQSLDVSTDPNDVNFFLYISKTEYTALSITPSSVNSTSNCSCYPTFRSDLVLSDKGWMAFKGGRNVVFIIHDFAQNSEAQGIQGLKDAYFDSRTLDFNVILVDWGKLSIPTGPGNTPISALNPREDYQKVVENVGVVGGRLAVLIGNMEEASVSYPERMHIIGFGLGAHVGGAAGKGVSLMGRKRVVNRVTGLDPSGSLFGISRPARMLRESDASFVDVVITEGGFQGDLKVKGTATFYPNGGLVQPGCDDQSTVGLCSHYYSVSLFKAAFFRPVKACRCSPLMGRENLRRCLDLCPAQTLLGPYVDQRAFGQFYVEAGYLPFP